MPRAARKTSSTGIYHVILRGVNREAIFIDDSDRLEFVKILDYVKRASKCVILCYCLMDNHVHILIKVNEEPLSTIIKRISGSYVLYFNRKHGRIGHLFQERFRSEPVENNRYFYIVFRYILQNPVKAGLTKKASEYRWSSYKDYTEVPGLTDVFFALRVFAAVGYNTTELFEEYVNAPNDDECLEYEDKQPLSDQEIRECIEQAIGMKVSEIKKLEKQERDSILRTIKDILSDVSLRQLERVTGLSKSLLSKI